MPGRYLHQPDGSGTVQPYGANGEAIYSVSRGELNKRLMTLAEGEGATIHFEQRCSRVDLATNELLLEPASPGSASAPTRHKADLLIGADGAFSALRTAYTYFDRVSSSMQYLGHAYKELTIPPVGGKPVLELHALHIWPRHNFMLIALPNTDGTFTCTLFLPFEGGDASFAALQTPEQVTAFFELHFADAVALMPGLITDFFANPTASLITTHIDRWHIGQQNMLIGDAAHAIVPFYGQGMNAGFEDCSVLAGLIDAHNDRWDEIMPAYQAARLPAGNAVAQLALLNFVEMRDKVADPSFLERKKIEKSLVTLFPGQFRSVYEMVSFTHTPYDTALRCTEAQDVLLGQLLAEGDYADFDRKMTLPDSEFKDRLNRWMDDYAAAVKQLDFGHEG
jgi:kynurenine 3-monooxygenase